MSTSRQQENKRVRHNNRRRGGFRLMRQRYTLPLVLLAALAALFVHLGALRFMPALYHMLMRDDKAALDDVKDEDIGPVVVRPPMDDYEAVEEIEPPEEPQEIEELNQDPSEIDILDAIEEIEILELTPEDTNIPLPTPEEDAPQHSDDTDAFMPPPAMDPKILGASDLADQAELIPEPTPVNSNTVIAKATPQSEALENANALIDQELIKQARNGDGGLEGDTRSLAGLMGMTNLGSGSGVARLKTDVLFAFNQSRLKNEARVHLLLLAALIHKNPQTRFIIEGHTDSIGGEEYNALLSLQRAAAVCHWLITNRVPVNNVYMRACGSSRPIDDVNGSRDMQKNNRRVEIHMRRPDEALPTGCLPATYEVDRDTPVQTQLKRGVRVPEAAAL